jgi:hypothetical protein
MRLCRWCLPLCWLGACAGSGWGTDAAPGSGACTEADAAAVSVSLPAGSVLARVDFEQRGPGTYTMAMVYADFGDGAGWNNGLDEGRATIVEEAGAHYLRVTYPAGKVGPNDAGVQFMVPLAGSHDELYLAYRVRFAGDFQFVKGGKLPGLVGGSAPTGCDLDAATLSDGFSARMMWRTGGAAVQLMYTSRLVGSCGDDFPYESCGTTTRFVPDRWHQVVHHLRMNTAGQPDGVMAAWLDGVLALSRTDVAFRSEGKGFAIDALYFSTFFGGSDPSWAPSTDQRIDFDDFLIATASPL